MFPVSGWWGWVMSPPIFNGLNHGLRGVLLLCRRVKEPVCGLLQKKLQRLWYLKKICLCRILLLTGLCSSIHWNLPKMPAKCSVKCGVYWHRTGALSSLFPIDAVFGPEMIIHPLAVANLIAVSNCYYCYTKPILASSILAKRSIFPHPVVHWLAVFQQFMSHWRGTFFRILAELSSVKPKNACFRDCRYIVASRGGYLYRLCRPRLPIVNLLMLSKSEATTRVRIGKALLDLSHR